MPPRGSFSKEDRPDEPSRLLSLVREALGPWLPNARPFDGPHAGLRSDSSFFLREGEMVIGVEVVPARLFRVQEAAMKEVTGSPPSRFPSLSSEKTPLARNRLTREELREFIQLELDFASRRYK